MPKPFVFKLQKILEYRHQLEEQAMMALAKARQQYQEYKEHLDRLRGRLEQHEASYFSKPDMTTADLWLWRNFKERLLQDIAHAELQLNQLANKVERAREEAIAKAKDRKLLEKLKTNQAEAYVKEELLKEQKSYDEMSTILYENPNL